MRTKYVGTVVKYRCPPKKAKNPSIIILLLQFQYTRSVLKIYFWLKFRWTEKLSQNLFPKLSIFDRKLDLDENSDTDQILTILDFRDKKIVFFAKHFDRSFANNFDRTFYQKGWQKCFAKHFYRTLFTKIFTELFVKIFYRTFCPNFCDRKIVTEHAFLKQIGNSFFCENKARFGRYQINRIWPTYYFPHLSGSVKNCNLWNISTNFILATKITNRLTMSLFTCQCPTELCIFQFCNRIYGVNFYVAFVVRVDGNFTIFLRKFSEFC